MEREIVNRTEEENMLRPVCLDGETPCSNGKECEACTFFKQSQPLIAFPNERCLLCERALATRTWAMTVSRGDYATGPFAHANYANRVSWLFDYPPHIMLPSISLQETRATGFFHFIVRYQPTRDYSLRIDQDENGYVIQQHIRENTHEILDDVTCV